MKYRELLEYLKTLPDNKLDMDVTVYVTGVAEFYSLVQDYPVVEVDSEIQNEFTPGAHENDALDDGHPYFVI